VQPAALGALAIVRAGVHGAPAASIEDDLGPGVGIEPGSEIVEEPLLGSRDDDEVRAGGVALDRSPEQLNSSQIW
jgi:hypothetical protein